MTDSQSKPDYIARPTIIAVLREELRRRANGEMSICRLAAENGIFCKGFRGLTDDQLKDRYGWISRRNPDLSREELEGIADRWQMARQEVVGAVTSCDVQQLEHDSCGGWDDFSDEDLARFLRELTGRSVEVTS